jgi:hypothetical protein
MFLPVACVSSRNGVWACGGRVVEPMGRAGRFRVLLTGGVLPSRCGGSSTRLAVSCFASSSGHLRRCLRLVGGASVAAFLPRRVSALVRFPFSLL